MLAGVSHDLKTPLTRMKLIIETLDNKDIKKDINDEINHMNEMLIEYLDFAASDDSKHRSVINPIEAITPSIEISVSKFIFFIRANILQ